MITTILVAALVGYVALQCIPKATQSLSRLALSSSRSISTECVVGLRMTVSCVATCANCLFASTHVGMLSVKVV